MNHKAIGLICLLPFLATCAQLQNNAMACKTERTPAQCDRGQPPQITITPGAIQAAPPRYCVAAGGTVEFMVAGDPEKASVATVPDNPYQIWLYRSNAEDAKTFSIQVPSDQEAGDYKYLVFFKNGKCIDPMITVTP